MNIAIGYIEEPPFGWTESNGTAVGADLELAEIVLHALGYTHVEHRLTTFEELLPGVNAGRWNMNVPIFVTQERSREVDFSMPVWAIGDGFIVAAGNPKGLDSYAAVARRGDARLGVMPSTVQLLSAQSHGVRDSQIVQFARQDEAIEALLAGRIDAYAGTALGNRVVAERIGHGRVAAVAHDVRHPPLGAFSFARRDAELRHAVDRELRRYLGSPDHRQRMARYGLTLDEIEPVLKR